MSRLIDQKGLIFSFQQRFIQTTTFRFGPERGLVVHLVVGIHVANVAVADQVHVSYVSLSNFNHVTEAEAEAKAEAEAASTWRHMLS